MAGQRMKQPGVEQTWLQGVELQMLLFFLLFFFKKGYFSRHFSSVFLTRYREINKMKVLPVGKYPNHHKLATWKVICIMWLHGSQLLDVDIHLENYKFVIFQCD